LEAQTSSQKLYYRIGEVSDISGVKPHVLRYWEAEFGFLSPQKNEGNQRLYSAKDLEKVLLIKKLLYDERYTIAGAKKKFREAWKTISKGAEIQKEREKALHELETETLNLRALFNEA
jgi:DNA-binding transcriptional MerR regulator